MNRQKSGADGAESSDTCPARLAVAALWLCSSAGAWSITLANGFAHQSGRPHPTTTWVSGMPATVMVAIMSVLAGMAAYEVMRPRLNGTYGALIATSWAMAPVLVRLVGE